MWRAVAVAWIAAAAFGAQDTCTLAGTVRDALDSRPIARASIRILAFADRKTGYAGTADASGAFRFEGVRPGDYVIDLQAAGHVDRSVLVRLSPGQNLDGLVLDMEPYATVSGIVSDADGDPIAGADVEAVALRWKRGVRRLGRVESAQTDDRGRYRLQLRAGRYILQAKNNGDLYVEQPGGPEMRMADVRHGAVELSPGALLAGHDFRLPAIQTHRVRGVVQPPPADTEHFWVMMRSRNPDVSSDSTRGGQIHKDGTFQINGVEPGPYTLEIFGPSSQRPHGRTTMEMPDADLNGVTLAAVGPVELRGRARLEDGTVPSGLKIRLSLADWSLLTFEAEAATNADGFFSFRDVPLGEYVIELSGPADLYVKSVTHNQRDAPGGRLALTGIGGELEVVLAAGGGHVHGSVQWPDPLPAGPLPVYTAVLVSAAGVTGNSGVRLAPVDPDGRCRWDHVPPGRYFAWVITHFDEDLWQDMEFVELVKGRASSLELDAQGNASVTVAILPDGDVRRTMTGMAQ